LACSSGWWRWPGRRFGPTRRTARLDQSRVRGQPCNPVLRCGSMRRCGQDRARHGARQTCVFCLMTSKHPAPQPLWCPVRQTSQLKPCRPRHPLRLLRRLSGSRLIFARVPALGLIAPGQAVRRKHLSCSRPARLRFPPPRALRSPQPRLCSRHRAHPRALPICNAARPSRLPRCRSNQRRAPCPRARSAVIRRFKAGLSQQLPDAWQGAVWQTRCRLRRCTASPCLRLRR